MTHNHVIHSSDIPEFMTYKYKDNMITDSVHCPSIELNLISNEKIFMIQ